MTSQTCCHGDKVVPAAVGSRTWSHGDWIVSQLETADWIVTHLGTRIEKKYLVPFWYLPKQFTLYFALTWRWSYLAPGRFLQLLFSIHLATTVSCVAPANHQEKSISLNI